VLEAGRAYAFRARSRVSRAPSSPPLGVGQAPSGDFPLKPREPCDNNARFLRGDNMPSREIPDGPPRQRSRLRTALTAFLTGSVLGIFMLGVFTNTFSSVVYDRWVKSIFETPPTPEVKSTNPAQESALPNDKKFGLPRDYLAQSVYVSIYTYQNKATVTLGTGPELKGAKYSIWALTGNQLSLLDRKTFDYLPERSARVSEVAFAKPFTRVVTCLSFEAEPPPMYASEVSNKITKMEFLANDTGQTRAFEKFRSSVTEVDGSALCDSMPQAAARFLK
jgi:hypothetical protein